MSAEWLRRGVRDIRELIEIGRRLTHSNTRNLSWLHHGFDRSLTENAVVITDNPERCCRMTLPRGQTEWDLQPGTLRPDELREFYASFGSHWYVLPHARVLLGKGSSEEHVPILCFVLNGRRLGKHWSIVLDHEGLFREEDGRWM